MTGVRIYELAKELGCPSKTLIDLLAGMGYPVKSHSSTIDNLLADRLVRQVKIKGLEKPKKKKAVAAPKEEGETAAAAEKKPAAARKAAPAPKPAADEPARKKSKPVSAKKAAKGTLKAAVEEAVTTRAAIEEEQKARTEEEQRQIDAAHKEEEKRRKAEEERRRKAEEEERARRKEEKKKRQDEEKRAKEEARVRKEEKRQRHESELERRRKEAEEAELARMIDEEEREKRAAEAKKIVIDEATTVKEFAEVLGLGAHEIIKMLMMKGIMANLNQTMDVEIARGLAEELGYEIKTREEQEIATQVVEAEEEGNLQPRPPVVTIMGHVDHGKTSLLDTIRKTNVTDTEAGGITQRIGAYQVRLDRGTVVFLDTPGHEAFTAMRSRGAAVTDLVILVVAADDGVMPQTIEAIHHAQAAGVPVIVAVNKIDKPGANPDRVRQELSNHGLIPEDWGGTTIFCQVSAKVGTGIDELLEMILLQADVLELRANPDRAAFGTIIESKLDKGRGAVATVLVQKGTLKVGDPFVAGTHYGKVRALMDDHGGRVDAAGPSMPVEILGFGGVPNAGYTFMVVESDRKAAQIAQARQHEERLEGLTAQAKGHVRLDNLHAHITTGEVKDLNLIVKADVQGSIEAVSKAFEDLSTADVRIRLLHGAVGGITETDVSLASASNAIIIGFNVRPTEKARQLAEAEEVDVRLYSVIYNAVDDVKAALEGMLSPVYKEVIVGRAEVRNTFHITKVGTIAGCMITSGKIIRNAKARLVRDSVVVHDGKVDSLKRFKDDAREVLTGFECGIGLENYNDIKLGDVIETYNMEEIERKLS